MQTRNPTGFCPRCNQNVLLTRKDFDTCLAIILLIFTAGIGLIIYLAVYYSRSEDRCVHCGTQITLAPSQRSYSNQPQTQTQSTLSPIPGSITEEIRGGMPNFCPLCGEKLEIGTKFCPNCGSKTIGE